MITRPPEAPARSSLHTPAAAPAAPAAALRPVARIQADQPGLTTLHRAVPTIASSADTDALRAFFTEHTSQESVAVIERGLPLGMINKNRFIASYLRHRSRSAVGTMPCTAWMSPGALMVDIATPLSEVLAMAEQPGRQAFVDGFVTTDGGRYAGLCTGLALRHARLALESATERQQLDFLDFAYPLLQHLHFLTHEHLARSQIDHCLTLRAQDTFGGDGVFVRTNERGTLLGVLRGSRGGVSCLYTGLSAQLWLDATVESLLGEAGEPDLGLLLQRLHSRLHADFAQENATEGLADALAHDTAPDTAAPAGLQAALVWLPHDGASLRFAGAQAALRLVRPGGLQVQTVAGMPLLLGQANAPSDVRWHTHSLPLDALHRVMLVTEGVTQLPGGPFSEPLGETALLRFLRTHSTLKAEDSGPLFEHHLSTWQGHSHRDSGETDLAALQFSAGGSH